MCANSDGVAVSIGINWIIHFSMKNNIINFNYDVALLKGNHGIWLFVKKDGQVIFEQSGIKSVETALQYAKAVIEHEEKSDE